jgi:hypothetical protein
VGFTRRHEGEGKARSGSTGKTLCAFPSSLRLRVKLAMPLRRGINGLKEPITTVAMALHVEERDLNLENEHSRHGTARDNGGRHPCALDAPDGGERHAEQGDGEQRG